MQNSRHSGPAWNLFALLIGLVALSGCAGSSTYRSPGIDAIPSAQIATLENNYKFPGGLNIIEVDEKHRGFGFFKTYLLGPGEHSLKFEWSDFGWRLKQGSNVVVLNFRTEAGGHYEIKYSLSKTGPQEGVFSSWIEDVRSRQRVSSTAGSEQPILEK